MTRPLRLLIGAGHARRVGGAETYLDSILPVLASAGHEIGFLFEAEGDPLRPPVRVPGGVPVWGPREVADIARWRPDVVYAQGFSDPDFEAAVLRLAPAVLFAHAYHGTCVSGTKTWTKPTTQMCSRRFGPACLIHYFPHGCGGGNPVTMARLYAAQRRRNRLLASYQAVLVASRHMAAEFRRHVPDPGRVQLVPLPFTPPTPPAADRIKRVETRVAEFAARVRAVRLLFLGRLEPNKGAAVAIVAAGRVSASLGRAVELTVVGDGAERVRLEARAAAARSAIVRFAGWQSGPWLATELERADLLLVPSLWSEPFGLVGLEAGWYGVPAAGFAHGGIPDWLADGETGALAPADSPTPDGLATAATRCLESADTLLRISRAALVAAARWPGPAEHVSRLAGVFEALRPGPAEVAGS